MSSVPEQCIFGRRDLAAALDGLLRESGGNRVEARTPPAPPFEMVDRNDDRRAVDSWLFDTADAWGLEARAVAVTSRTERDFLRSSPPALFLTAAAKAIVLLRARGTRVTLLTRDRKTVTISARSLSLASLLGQPAQAPWEAGLFDAVGVNEHARPAAVAAFRDEGEARTLGIGYVIGLPPSASLLAQARARGLGKHVVVAAVAALLNTTLALGSLAIFGNTVLSGRVRSTYLIGWALLLLTTIPVRLILQRAQARLAIGVAVLSRRRLLEGALRLAFDRVRAKGVGAFLALVNEAEAVERLALQVGLSAIVYVANLIGLIVFLSYAQSALLLVLLALGTLAGTLYVARRWYTKLGRFMASRIALSDDLVAKMVGSRTRRTQQARAYWHDGEDEAVREHVRVSTDVDRSAVILEMVPRLWSIAALLVLVPAFGSGTSSASLIIGITGILIFGASLQGFVAGIFDVGRLVAGWRDISDLVRAGRAEAPPLSLSISEDATLPKRDGDVLIHAAGLDYAYPGRARAVLADVSLQIRRGERLLVEGPSGGGKSTLASILSGLRTPSSGLILVDGLDQFSQTPARWQRNVSVAPQFHENHVFLNTLRFNLLLGRAWPPSEADMARAREILTELGLGPLLERMPAGLFEMVGETGWRLSHGEQSRVYIARSLLQDSEVVVFDESFGALDPETLALCIKCVLRRARTLVVIAHP
jgi:ATP-binding cassette subfamily B protein